MTKVDASLEKPNSLSSEDLLRAAMASLRSGDVVMAAKYAEEAREYDQSAQVLIVFAAISYSLGRFIDALSMLDLAMQRMPSIANYPDAAAAILLNLGRKADGMFNLKLGTHLPSDPFLDEIIGNFFGDVKQIFDSFVENRPLVTARLMMEQRLYSTAKLQLETYIGVSGGDVESFSLIIECALKLGAMEDAEVAFKALAALSPTHAKLKDYSVGIAILKGNASEIDAAVKSLQEVNTLNDALERYRLLSISPFVSTEALNASIENIVNLSHPVEGVLPFSLSENADLSVGFICAVIDPALEAILLSLSDRLSIKVYLLGTGGTPSLQRIKAALRDVRDVTQVDDLTLVEMIRADQISVLFDCVGAAPFARPDIWKSRMAPLQVLWAMPDAYDDTYSYDYRLVDHIKGYNTENTREISLGMPLNYPLPPAELQGRVAEVRATKVSRDEESFGTRRLLAPHPMGLLTDEALEVYLSILQAVPNATLSFVAISDLQDPLVQRVLDCAEPKGCADRIELISPADFRAGSHEIMLDADLILDSFPYGNIDFIIECLWIGCPVITLAGVGYRQRASANIVAALGLEKCVADSSASYQALAIRLLQNDDELSNLKNELRLAQQSLTVRQYELVASALIDKIESLWNAKRSIT